jgi:hypothetical protein
MSLETDHAPAVETAAAAAHPLVREREATTSPVPATASAVLAQPLNNTGDGRLQVVNENQEFT